MSHRECANATVKVTLTGPDGKVLKVIEGEGPDPFAYSFINDITITTDHPADTTGIIDSFGNTHVVSLITSSPMTSLGYLIASFCLIGCPNTGSTPPNGPGIWLFSSVPDYDYTYDWAYYEYYGIAPQYLITGLSYSPLTVNKDTSSPSSPGEIVYYLLHVAQSITNTLSSPVNIYTIVLVGAVYSTGILTGSASPIYMPITFYVFSPPIVLSPGVTMSVSITLSFPYGIALGPASLFS